MRGGHHSHSLLHSIALNHSFCDIPLCWSAESDCVAKNISPDAFAEFAREEAMIVLTLLHNNAVLTSPLYCNYEILCLVLY